MQEGAPEVYAKIQCLCPDGFDTYIVTDTMESPVSEIEIVVPAPCIIKHHLSDSATCLPMTEEV